MNYERTCPKCNLTKIPYKTETSYNRANRLNRVCMPCTALGRVLTQEHKDKIGKSLKGKYCGVLNPIFGKGHTEETKTKISKSMSGKNNHWFGKKLTDEHRDKLSKSHIGYKMSSTQLDNIQKSRYKKKEYVFSDGRIEFIQGYENLTIDKLISENIPTDVIKIKTQEKSVVSYEFEGKLLQYFPDCYLFDKNCIVETKSTYTWNKEKDRNMAKMTACLNAGFSFRLVIWNDDKTLLSDIVYLPNNKEVAC